MSAPFHAGCLVWEVEHDELFVPDALLGEPRLGFGAIFFEPAGYQHLHRRRGYEAGNSMADVGAVLFSVVVDRRILAQHAVNVKSSVFERLVVEDIPFEESARGEYLAPEVQVLNPLGRCVDRAVYKLHAFYFGELPAHLMVGFATAVAIVDNQYPSRVCMLDVFAALSGFGRKQFFFPPPIPLRLEEARDAQNGFVEVEADQIGRDHARARYADYCVDVMRNFMDVAPYCAGQVFETAVYNFHLSGGVLMNLLTRYDKSPPYANFICGFLFRGGKNTLRPSDRRVSKSFGGRS